MAEVYHSKYHLQPCKKYFANTWSHLYLKNVFKYFLLKLFEYKKKYFVFSSINLIFKYLFLLFE